MPEDFIHEFADADLKDSRRTRRLGKVVSALMNSPGMSISAACGGWSETMAAYRLLNCEDVTAVALIAPHRQATIQRCAGFPCVIVSQDTTEFDFSHMTAAEGFGPLNDEKRRGFHMHSHYAVSEEGLPLGLLDITTMVRDDETFRANSKIKHRPIEEKESYRWVQGYRLTLDLAKELPNCEVFSISDREGDISEVFQEWKQAAGGPRAEWIIRANKDRALINVADGEADKLFAALEEAPILGEIEFKVPASKGTKKVKGSRVATFRSARTVHQVVRAMKITPRPPRRKGVKLEEVSFWAIIAEELNPPEGEDPIRWHLLTSKEVNTMEGARRILNLYMRRWDIEVFHRVLKTGCKVERIQLKTNQAVINAIMIYSVIAWRILYFTHLGRQCPNIPCSCVFEEAEWKAACAVVKRKKDASEPSLSEFIGIVGRLGGHLGRERDGAPGPQSIWQGLARVRDFAYAWHAFHSR